MPTYAPNQSGDDHYFLSLSARQLQRSLESLLGELDWRRVSPLGMERIDEE